MAEKRSARNDPAKIKTATTYIKSSNLRVSGDGGDIPFLPEPRRRKVQLAASAALSAVSSTNLPETLNSALLSKVTGFPN